MRMGGRSIVGGTLALLLILGWLAFPGDEEPDDQGIELGSLSGEGRQQAGSRTGRKRGASRRHRDGGGRGIRNALEAAGTGPASRRCGPRVRVVDSENGRPVPGAIVAFVDYDGPANGFLFKAPSTADRFDAMALGYGRLFRADDEGEVLLPHFGREAEVRASAPFGRSSPAMITTEDLHQVFDLEIVRMQPVKVTVVDSQDQPQARIPVALYSTGDNPFVRREESVTWTDEKGRALVYLPPWHGPRAHFFVAAKTLSLHSRLLEVFPDAGDRITRIVLDRGSTLHVHIQDSEGNPYPESVMVSITGETPEGISTPTVSRTVTDGELLVTRVQPGLRFVVHAASMEPGHLAAWKEFDGPVAPGDVVRVLLRFDRPGAEIGFTIVGTNGFPLANTPLCGDLSSYADGEQVDGEDLDAWRTDGRGHVTLRFPDKLGHGGRRHLVRVWRFASDTRVDETASLWLPPPPWDRIDLGKVQLRRVPILVGGVITGESGAPVAHASIEVVPLDGAEGLGEFAESTTRSAPNGQFRLSSPRSDISRVRLKVFAEGYLPRIEEVKVPQEGLEFTLKEGGTLILRVQPSPVLSHVSLKARLTGPGAANLDDLENGGQPESFSRLAGLKKGKFIFRGLAPGSVQLDVLSPFNDREVLVSLGSFLVPPSGEVQDARLLDLDLEQALALLTFKVVDTHGQPVGDARVTARRGTADVGRCRTSGTGEAYLVAAKSSSSVVIAKPGFATRHLTIEGIRKVMTLMPAIRAHFQLEPMVDIPQAPLFIQGVVRDRSSNALVQKVFPGPNGRMSLDLPGPGAYEIRFHFMKQTASMTASSSSWLVPIEPLRFTVDGHDPSPGFDIKCDGNQFQEALQSVR